MKVVMNVGLGSKVQTLISGDEIIMKRATIALAVIIVFTAILVAGCGKASSDKNWQEPTIDDRTLRGDESPVGVIEKSISAIESGDLLGALACFREDIQEDYEALVYYFCDFGEMLANFKIVFNNVKLIESPRQDQYAEVLVTSGSVTVSRDGFDITMDLVGDNENESIELVRNSDGSWGIDNASSGLDNIAQEILDKMCESLYGYGLH